MSGRTWIRKDVPGAIRAGAVLAGLMMTGVPAKPALPSPRFGINFSFYNVDTSQVTECPNDPNATIRGKEFLTRYHDPAVRQEVRKQLAAMRGSGFEEIRTLVFFGPDSKQPANWFLADKEADRAGVAVRAFAEDVARAGYSELELAFGPMGALKPSCRQRVWGDCFDPGTIPVTVGFMATVRAGLGSPPLPLRIDVSNESCVSSAFPPTLRDNMRAFLTAVVQSYSRNFGQDRLTASCVLERFAAARASIDSAFAAANRSPDFYELHAYHYHDREAAPALARAADLLASLPQPVVLGEVTYGDHSYLDGLLSALPRVSAVDFWPLAHWQSGCNLDTSPPYSLQSAISSRKHGQA